MQVFRAGSLLDIAGVGNDRFDADEGGASRDDADICFA